MTELRPEEYEIGYSAMKNILMVFRDGAIIEGSHFFAAMLMGRSADESGRTRPVQTPGS